MISTTEMIVNDHSEDPTPLRFECSKPKLWWDYVGLMVLDLIAVTRDCCGMGVLVLYGAAPMHCLTLQYVARGFSVMNSNACD